jgi:hypothetical protein
MRCAASAKDAETGARRIHPFPDAFCMTASAPGHCGLSAQAESNPMTVFKYLGMITQP